MRRQFHAVLAGIAVGLLIIACYYALSESIKKDRKQLKINNAQHTFIRIIDIPEELDAVSTDSTSPSIMQAYRHKDTLFLGYK